VSQEKAGGVGSPREAELRQLPRLAVVAFAARCARRVLPLFERAKGMREYEKHRSAVEEAVHQAEAVATGTVEVARVATAAAAAAAATAADAKAAQYAALTAATAANAAEADSANVAIHAAATAAVAGSAVSAEATAAANAAVSAVSAAAISNALAARARITSVAYRAIRRDYELLLAWTQQGWEIETFLPEVFGPIWPEGPPPGWPEEQTLEGDQGSGDIGEIVLEIKVPEGATDEEALRVVQMLTDLADRTYRSVGGRGLKVTETNITDEAAVPQEAQP
jgi:hypothetical protein